MHADQTCLHVKVSSNSWTVELLVEAINNGWRDANGIISKQTIEAKIVPVLNEKLGCKKIEDHVKNHMKTLKGRFQSICQLFRHSSGVSWDHVTKKLTASDEREKKKEMEKKEEEKNNNVWDAIKEIPNLDAPSHYKAVALVQKLGMKKEFLKMTPEEHSEWIKYNME
ncbi:uncharacterized protein At2g29880-like [Malus domestica]|uniref:uncharacterized protein At2g29880-like n=1 Tax=Malus domestica TaxID=3750 RepID=UPI003975B1A5